MRRRQILPLTPLPAEGSSRLAQRFCQNLLTKSNKNGDGARLAHFVWRVTAAGSGPEVGGHEMRFLAIDPKLGKRFAQNSTNPGVGKLATYTIDKTKSFEESPRQKIKITAKTVKFNVFARNSSITLFRELPTRICFSNFTISFHFVLLVGKSIKCVSAQKQWSGTVRDDKAKKNLFPF